jgi:hypothetical protein
MTNGPTQEVLAMGGMTLNRALGFHLSSRCFPPVHADFYPPIKQAIDFVAVEGTPSAVLELPNGRSLFAYEVIEQLRLEDFVQARQEGEQW